MSLNRKQLKKQLIYLFVSDPKNVRIIIKLQIIEFPQKKLHILDRNTIASIDLKEDIVTNYLTEKKPK